MKRLWNWYDGNTDRRRAINAIAFAFTVAVVLILTQIA